jgi:alpha-mannosidase
MPHPGEPGKGGTLSLPDPGASIRRMPRVTIHLIPHSHWDREWYLPLGGFQARLARAVDGVLDLLARERTIPAFHLDGQTVLLEDYLALRPERREPLAKALAEGRLTSGPWHVLADEQVPAGESLLRNLALGRLDLTRLTGRPPDAASLCCYSPDAFGHPAALPAVAAEYGLEAAVVWRGLHPDQTGGKDFAWWRAPDGRRVLLYHLPADGYEIGSNLLVPDVELAEAWARVAGAVLPRAATAHVAVFVGADHHAVAPGLAGLPGRLARIEPGHAFRLSSLPAFLGAARAEAETRDLAEVSGELRWSYGYTWTLQGAHATRTPLKRRHSEVELLLLRRAEPLAALAGSGEAGTLERAWRQVVQGEFHDTLAGTCHDAVAQAFATRLTDAEALGREVARTALHRLAGHDPDGAREGVVTDPRLVLWNPAARPRGGVVLAEVTCFRRDLFVGPPGARRPRTGPGFRPFGLRVGDVTVMPQVLDVTPGIERIDAARHYPDQDEVDVVRLAFPLPASVPGLGLAAVELTEAEEEPPEPFVAVGRGAIGNGRLHAAVSPAGLLQLFQPSTGLRFDDLAQLESEGDAGDTYTFAPTPAEHPVVATGRGRARVTAKGPLVAGLEWRRSLRRASGRVSATFTAELVGDNAVLRGQVALDNQATDHRLRLRFPLGLRRARSAAGSAFGPVERPPLAAKPRVTGQLRETPVPTAPAHRWVVAARGEEGLAILMPGFFEYEWTVKGELIITLLRAVGELSRADLPTRPGHAGWYTPTPGAQCLGPEVVPFALAFATERDLAEPERLEELWEDAFLPLEATWLRQATMSGAPAPSGMALEGRGLVFSSCHPAWDGEGLLLRCYNARPEPVEGRWRFARALARAARVRADGTPSGAAVTRAQNHELAFEAGPHELVTFHLTFA